MSDEHKMNFDSMEVKIVRMEERLAASGHALELAREELMRYQETNNHWREAMNDQRSAFVTRSELIAAASVIVAIVVLAMKFIK